MSGFTIRRFTLQNIAAVAAHCPIPGVSQAALNITYGPAAVKAAVHAAAGAGKVNDGSKTDPGSDLSKRLLALLVGSATATSSSAAASAPHGGSTFSLVTEEEMLWIQKRRREDADESRVVLATRPTRNIVKGLAGGLLNVALGCLLSPLIFLTITLERIRLSRNPFVGLVVGPMYGAAWAAVFLLTSLYAAAQQTVMSFYYSCMASPTYYLVNRPALLRAKEREEAEARKAVESRATAWFWSPLLCRFAVPVGNARKSEPLLFCYDENDILRERAMKRLAVRRKKDKSRAQYEGKKKSANPLTDADDDDYYGLLGVDPNASEREIKAAYNKLVLKIHPDKNPAPGAAVHFDNVTKAYRVLSNAEKRKKYDLGGAKGVEDLGAKKREGVRALFGGETLVKLSGDVFMGSFSQRVIDGLDYTQEELAVLQQRVLQQCRDELLEHYLSHYIDWRGGGAEKGASNDATGGNPKTGVTKSLNAWDGKMKLQLKKIVSTGLAKEVLYVIGCEYKRAVLYFDASVNGVEKMVDRKKDEESGSEASGIPTVAPLPVVIARRLANYANEVGPHRMRAKASKAKYFARVRRDTFKSPESMIDLAWYSSAEDIEKTARAVALAVLFDPETPPNEVLRRRAALSALADVFMHYGQVYRGANKQTMDQLMNSLRDYQQQKEREKNA